MFGSLRIIVLLSVGSLAGFGQNSVSAPPSTPATDTQGLKQREVAPSSSGNLRIEPGTHILLNMINSVSTKQAVVGDRMYLETAFPVLAAGHIVIPQGSWVTGTITQVKRPGRVKGRGELQVSFDSITLPNGVTRNLHSDLGAIDARANEKLNRERSKVTGPSNKKGDTETVIGTATSGTVIGSGVGAAAGSIARGAGVGAGAGAAAGLLGVLLSRGPDAMLTKGSTVEMIVDHPLIFNRADLDFSSAPPRATLSEGGDPAAQRFTSRWAPRVP